MNLTEHFNGVIVSNWNSFFAYLEGDFVESQHVLVSHIFYIHRGVLDLESLNICHIDSGFFYKYFTTVKFQSHIVVSSWILRRCEKGLFILIS